MKKRINILLCISVFCLLIAGISNAQTPQAIPYQGVARNNSGNIIAGQNISLRLSIHDVTPAGTVVYKETHSATTNTLGLFTVNIGSGTIVTGTLSGVAWGTGAKYLQVELDPAGGVAYTDMGTTQLNSVPYALYAENANVPGVAGPQGPAGATGPMGPQGPAGNVSALTPIGSSPNADGATLTGTVLNLEPADATNGGVVTTGIQTFAGAKTFSSDITANGITVGKSGGNNSNNTAVGTEALFYNAGGGQNTAMGFYASLYNSNGSGNTAVGNYSLIFNQGSNNTAVGNFSLADNNPVYGSNNSVFGSEADIASPNLNNATAIGANAIANASNQVQLGNPSVTNVNTSGTYTAGAVTYPNTHGANGQVLSTTGSGTLAWVNPQTGTTWNLTSAVLNTNGTTTINTSIPSSVTTATGAWRNIGNTGMNGGNTTTAGTNYIGTTDAQNLDFRTNNIFRGRFTSAGEFFVGSLNTTITEDLMTATGNATFPWATNGLTAFNGAGVFGQVTGGTTIFAGVQGEYVGTNAQGAGVRGMYQTTTAGTAFTNAAAGVSGIATTSGAYKFGVWGTGGTTARSGGVIGNDYGLALGALGYYSFSAVDYGVYGFGQAHTTGSGTGRVAGGSTTDEAGTETTVGWDGQVNTNIGIGIYGGVMGGWVRGMAYGMHVKGKRYSMYVDGTSYTNKPTAQLIDKQDGSTNRVAAYTSSSMTSDVSSRGKAQMVNGEALVAFDINFKGIISDPSDLVITVTPTGNSNGVYVSSVTEEGFVIKENNSGTSSVAFSWIAIATIKGNERLEVPAEVLSTDFDSKMRGVMFNDHNTTDTPQPMWWDGAQIRFDTPPEKQPDPNAVDTSRPKR